jgi:cytochrome c oxidase subunit 2
MADRPLRRFRPWIALAVAIAALAFALPGLAGTYPQTTLEPRSEVARLIDALLDNIVLWCVIIFVLVEGALVVTVVRFRRRPGGPAPRAIHGNTPLEILWTIIPAIILALIAVPTVKTIFRTQTLPKDALEVQVVGHQWWWEFRYPQLGITTANELYIPSGRDIAFTLTSVDVIHSFWVPAFGGKRDVIPGRQNHMWFNANATGSFPGQCTEYCGASHANMLFKVVAQPEAEFASWVAQQKDSVAAPDTTTLAAKGLELYRKGMCVACHTIDKVSYGTVGPNLSKVAMRSTIASGILPNDPEHLRAWIKDAPSLKPGSLMPSGTKTMNLSNQDVEALAAYLETRR